MTAHFDERIALFLFYVESANVVHRILGSLSLQAFAASA